MTDQQPAPKRQPKWLKATVALLVTLLLGAVGGGVYWYLAYQKAVSSNPLEERRQLVEILGASVILPDEDPQVATVQDAAKLSNATLARKAKDGDKLLVFNVAKRIYIYRPSERKLVDILTIQAEEPLTR